MNDKKFYVYIYLDFRKCGNFTYGEYQFKYEPFYVGKGTGNRSTNHLCEWHLKNDKNKLKVNKIKKIKNPIIIKFKENLSNNEAINLEISLIKSIGRIDTGLGPLTNLTNGGEGSHDRICKKETKEKISKNNKGRKLNDEQKERISIGHKGNRNYWYGKKHSNDSKKKISDTHKLNGYSKGNKNPRAIFNYIIKDANENQYISDCLKEFCKENNINYSSFKDAINRGKPYKNWQATKILKN